MRRLDPADLATSIVGLRRAIVKTRDTKTRASLRDIEVLLRRTLGPTIPKKKAAAVLGISVPALDRWVNRGLLPVVAKPGSSRLEVESRAFLELAERVETVTDELGEMRTPVSVAIKSLGWTSPKRNPVTALGHGAGPAFPTASGTASAAIGPAGR